MSIKKININLVIAFITVLSLIVGFLTIQTFAGKGLISLNSLNIQILLIVNLVFLSSFLVILFIKFLSIYVKRKNTIEIGNKTQNRILIYFISLAAIPSIVVAIFSLLIFNFSIEKWFDKKINDVVNNSVEVAKRYLNEHQLSISKDILLTANDFNRNKELLISNKERFEKYIEAQARIRSINNLFIVTDKGDLVYSIPGYNFKNFPKPDKYILLAAYKGKPIIISSAFTNKSYGMVKLSNFDNLYLYVIQDVDPQIVSNLKKTGEASTYYVNIKNNIFSLQVTFMIIYIIITLILVFLSSIISINLSNYFTRPLISLFNASNEIKKGNYNFSLDEKNLDTDFAQLSHTFNEMLSRIRSDQKKISLTGRFEAWNIIAKKLAHEIKNPLTPIQLSLDTIKDKFKSQITIDKKVFDQHIEMINHQIIEINSLLNSFSDFARMPEPVLDKNNIIEIVNNSINPYKSNYSNIEFDVKSDLIDPITICDKNQIFRLFTNLIKNAVESINEKNSKDLGKISVSISSNSENIIFEINDTGIGFPLDSLNNIHEPYFTTKNFGSGLGLSIAGKIIHEHNGEFQFMNNDDGGAKIKFSIKK